MYARLKTIDSITKCTFIIVPAYDYWLNKSSIVPECDKIDIRVVEGSVEEVGPLPAGPHRLCLSKYLLWKKDTK